MASLRGPSLVILAAGRARRFGGIKPLAPIGINGEAVLDLGASDAITAGFAQIVIVINNETGPVIRDHIANTWPSNVRVEFAIQDRPLGTVDAVLRAREFCEHGEPFAVINADDLYGTDALGMTVKHLVSTPTNMLVGFRLDRALVGSDPVTRGICEVIDGRLASITERRSVVALEHGYESHDDLEPRSLNADALVSMNLWGFVPSMWTVFQMAMEQAEAASEDNEVLLPELVSDVLQGRYDALDSGLKEFSVLPTDTRCIGVTHPDDLGVVQEEIALQIKQGFRPKRPFELSGT